MKQRRHHRAQGKNRFNGNRGNSEQNSRRTHANALKNKERYLNMAKDAASSGDIVQAEHYYQFSDHYHRVAAANAPAERTPERDNSGADEQPDVNDWEGGDSYRNRRQPQRDEDDRAASDAHDNSDDDDDDERMAQRAPRRRMMRTRPVDSGGSQPARAVSTQPDTIDPLPFLKPASVPQPTIEAVAPPAPATTEDPPKRRRGRPPKKAVSETSE